MIAGSYSLVMLGRFPGKDRAVAAALARDFGRDEPWAAQVLGAAPIVLLDGLSAEQANAIHAALAEVEAAGSRFEVQQGLNTSLPKIGWPSPAKIKGRAVTEYASAGATQGTTATLIVPCPYTGQKMKLTITVSLAKAGEQPALAVAAAAAPIPIPVPTAPIPIPVPSPQGRRPSGGIALPPPSYKPIPTPVVTPAVRSGTPAVPASTRKLTPGGGAPAKAAPPQAPIIVGLEELDELQPLEQFPAPPAIPVQRLTPSAPPRPAAPPVQRPTGGAPLPDIPVLPTAPQAPTPATDALGSASLAPMPLDLMSAPMDLSAFEAKASGIRPAATVPAPPASNNGDVCSVFIGKSANPKVHQLVAGLQKISVQQAAQLCQKPVVSVAKDVSMAEADSIKQQFAAVNMPVRIQKRA